MEVLKPKALEMNFQMVGIRNFRIQGRSHIQILRWNQTQLR